MIKRLGLWLAVAGFLAPTTASAATLEQLEEQLNELRSSYEHRVEQLEAEIAELKKNQKSAPVQYAQPQTTAAAAEEAGGLEVEYVGRNQEMFGKGGLLVRDHSGFGHVSVGGYIDHEFENFQNTDSNFDQHRWIINIGAELGDRLRFYSEYEIEHGGPNSANNAGEAKVEQAQIDFMITDWVNARAGALLVPFGRYNIYHDSDLQDLTDRPLVARRVTPTTWTEAGAGLFGSFNPIIGDYEDLLVSYEGYVINGLEEDTINDRGFRSAKGSLGSDNNNSKSVVGRLMVSPLPGHEIGFSGYHGNYANSGDADITGGGIDWFSSYGPVELVGEYAYFDVEEVLGGGQPDEVQGFYAQANYHFWPEFLDNTFLGKRFDHPTFTLIGRYGWAQIDDDADINVGDNEEERITLGLNYRPVESWVLKLEYQWNDTDNEALERGDNDGFMASVAMGF